MNSHRSPQGSGASIGPADLTLPATQPIDLTALLAAQLPAETTRERPPGVTDGR